MNNPLTGKPYRIQSIDVLRGIVMVIMALDHVRDFFFKIDIENASGVATDPTNMETTTPALFFTRWITHFCAPVFVLLTGTSAFLISQRKSKKELSLFLIKRGIWLVIAELLIVNLAWTFNPLYNFNILQVIYAIGMSMIVLGFMVYLPWRAILAIGLIIVFGHHLLEEPTISKGLRGGLVADLVYYGQFSYHVITGDRGLFVVYSFLPWTGIMLVGYALGRLYMPGIDMVRRKKLLVTIGLGTIILFIALRSLNLYGDPLPWSKQSRGGIYTLLSFLNTNKYPPSLLFVLMTTGPAMIALALLEKWRNGFTSIMNVYGRVPMFYYIMHLYLIHFLLVILFFITGHGAEDIVTPNNPFLFRPSDIGFGLGGVYLVWLLVIILLYPICKAYDRYKSTHDHWWLSYI